MTAAEVVARETALRVALEAAPDPGTLAEVRAFQAACPSASWLQRPDWAALCPPPERHRYVFLTARGADGGLRGTALARLSTLAAGRRLATLRRGPVTRVPGDLGPVTRAFAARLRAEGAVSLVVNPRFSDDEAAAAEQALSAIGAHVLSPEMQSLHRATYLFDLSGDEAALMARLKGRARRQLKKAAAAGIGVRPAETPEEADRFGRILADFHRRRGLGLESIPSARTQWEMTRDRGAFLLAFRGDALLGGHTVIPDGDRAFWLTLASTDDGGRDPVGYPLLWEAMRLARAQGFRSYDMAGGPSRHDPEDAGEDAAGRYQFKTAFGPDRVELVPAMVLALRRPDHDILFGLRNSIRAWRKARGPRVPGR